MASQAPSSFRAWPASRTPHPAASPAPGDSCKVPSETPPPVRRSLHFRDLIYRKFHRCGYCSSIQWALAASDGPFSKNVQISAWGREEGEGSRGQVIFLGFYLSPGCESCALYLPFLYLRVHFYLFLNNPVTVNIFLNKCLFFKKYLFI